MKNLIGALLIAILEHLSLEHEIHYTKEEITRMIKNKFIYYSSTLRI